MCRDRDPTSSSVTSTPVVMSSRFATDGVPVCFLLCPIQSKSAPDGIDPATAIIGAARASILSLQTVAVTTCKQVTGNDESTEAGLKGLLFQLMYDFQ